MKVEMKIRELGLEVPAVTLPIANYQPGVLHGNEAYVSGQLPLVNGKIVCAGKVGAEVTPEDAYDAAKTCALNALGVLKSLLGDLDRVEKIVKIVGFVNSDPAFTGQPKVINGASDLLGAVFGENGVHARSAVGAASLPLGAACEVELIAKVRD